jgi:hypothetical protein
MRENWILKQEREEARPGNAKANYRRTNTRTPVNYNS